MILRPITELIVSERLVAVPRVCAELRRYLRILDARPMADLLVGATVEPEGQALGHALDVGGKVAAHGLPPRLGPHPGQGQPVTPEPAAGGSAWCQSSTLARSRQPERIVSSDPGSWPSAIVEPGDGWAQDMARRLHQSQVRQSLTAAPRSWSPAGSCGRPRSEPAR